MAVTFEPLLARERSWRSWTRRRDAQWWMVLPFLIPWMSGPWLIAPAMPKLMINFFGDADRAARVQSLTDSSGAVLSILFSTQLGKLSDSIGRQPLILLCACCTLWPLSCLALSNNLMYYMVVSAICGFLGNSTSQYQSGAIQAYIADCSEAHVRLQNLGLIGAMFFAMMMIMPPMGSFLESTYGSRSLFWTALSFELVAVVMALFLPESLPADQAEPLSKSMHEAVASLGQIKSRRGSLVLQSRRGSLLWHLAVIRFVEGLGTNGLMTIMNFTLTQVVGFQDADFASLFLWIGFCSVMVQSVVLRILAKCGRSETEMMLFAQGARMIAYTAYSGLGFFPSKALVFGLEGIESFTTIWDAAFTSLVTKGNEEEKGFALGLFQAVDGFTRVISPLMMALAFQMSPVAPWAIASVFSSLTMLLLLRLPSA